MTKKHLRDIFSTFDKRILSTIDKIDDKEFIVCDELSMVHEPNLHHKRTILLGDAGYGPTSLSGMGGSLALIGSKALMHFIQKHPNDVETALQKTNDYIKPIIKYFHEMAHKNKKFIITTPFQYFMGNMFIQLLPKKAFLNAAAKRFMIGGDVYNETDLNKL